MYCMNCGHQVPDKAKYCPKCGETLQHIPDNSDNTVQELNNQNIKPPPVFSSYKIKEFSRSYNHKSVGFIGFQIFLLIILISFGVILMLNKDLDSILRTYAFFYGKSSELDIIKLFIWLLIIIDGITLIIKIVKISVICKTHVVVNETGVYGSGGKESLLSKSDFNLNYSDITHVSTQSGNLIIHTKSGNYCCRIENETDAMSVINNTLSESHEIGYIKSNNTNSNYFSSEMWICPSCGKRNYNYVGTCGCGTQKTT